MREGPPEGTAHHASRLTHHASVPYTGVGGAPGVKSPSITMPASGSE